VCLLVHYFPCFLADRPFLASFTNFLRWLSRCSYGHSEGSPSERGIKLDSQTALDYVLSHPKLEKTPIFLYGQSIGGAVAVHLASQNSQRLQGLVIENTFRSLVRFLYSRFPQVLAISPPSLLPLAPASRLFTPPYPTLLSWCSHLLSHCSPTSYRL
jgi:pimeloyl-ACP methyl ester carboxylesterase